MDLGNRPRSISQYRWDREMPVRLSTSGLRKKRSLRPASARGALAGVPVGRRVLFGKQALCEVAL